MIVIFSQGNDVSTRDVETLLQRMSCNVIIIEPFAAFEKFSLISDDCILFRDTLTGETHNLLEASACWWRRTGIGIRNFSDDIPKTFSSGGFNFSRFVTGVSNLIKNETCDLAEYIYDMIYKRCPKHIGNPHRMGLNRLTTLEMAKAEGLAVPNYAVISNYNQLESLHCISDTFVTKAISNGIYDFNGHDAFYTYTEAMHKRDFKNKDILLFPSLVMSMVEKSYEVRSFYMDGKFYSMAIFSQSNDKTKVDFRKYSMDTPNKNEPYKLPKEIENKLENIYHKLDLNSGSADLMVDKNGNYVFLEINPVGQFQMTSRPCNYNLEQIIANYLAYGIG